MEKKDISEIEQSFYMLLEERIKELKSNKRENFKFVIEYAEKGYLSFKMFIDFCNKYAGIKHFDPKYYDENLKEYYEKMFKIIWQNMNPKNAKLLREFMDEMKKFEVQISNGNDKKNVKYTPMWLFEIIDPSDRECMNVFLENHFSDLSEEKKKEKVKRFYQLWRIDGIADLDSLEDEFDGLNIGTIIRLRTNDFFKRAFIIYSNSPNKEFFFKIINHITKEDGENELISRVMIALLEYGIRKRTKYEFFYTLINEDELFEKFFQIMIYDPYNTFNIDTIQDIENYEKTRKEQSLKVLLGQEVSINPKIEKMPEWKRKKFALFELLYGIAYDQAENLVKKYGKDIDKIEPKTDEERIIIDYIKALNTIIELDDEVIRKMIHKPEFIEFCVNTEPPKMASSYILERDIVSMFEREYNKYLSLPTPVKKTNLLFRNKEIPVELYSPIGENGNFRYTEFAILIRTEGAFNKNWKLPDNYADFYNVQSAKYSLNSKSLINQSQIADVKLNGFPKIGYLNVDKIIFMSPWDMVSSQKKDYFSPINEEWNSTYLRNRI